MCRTSSTCWTRATPSPSSPATARSSTAPWTTQLLRQLADRLQYLRQSGGAGGRRSRAAIENQGKLTQELSDAIDAAATLAEVEDLYRPYKQKRRTRATVAREKGLEPLARAALRPGRGLAGPPARRPQDFMDPDKGVETAEDALQGASDILAEQISDDAAIRKTLRELYAAARGMLRSPGAAKEEDSGLPAVLRLSQSRAPSSQGHQVLAINRGETGGLPQGHGGAGPGDGAHWPCAGPWCSPAPRPWTLSGRLRRTPMTG